MNLEEQLYMLDSLLMSAGCKHTKVAALIINKGMLVSVGVNSSPCNTLCVKRTFYGIGHADERGHAHCMAIHAEINAIGAAAKHGHKLAGTTMIVTHRPCRFCAKAIVASGIKEVRFINDYRDEMTTTILREGNVKLQKLQLKSIEEYKEKFTRVFTNHAE